MNRIVQRITNASPQRRLLQLVNVLAVATRGRALGISHLVEHPKCGGSWVRNMMQHYLGGEPYLVDRLVGRRTVVQVHRLYRARYCNPVVVFRDPRDMFVSFYYHETRYDERERRLDVHGYLEHDPDRPVREDFAAYLEAKLTHRTHPGFSYAQFVDSWIDRPEACIVRYEDCLIDAGAELARILEFLGESVDAERLAASVDFNRFESETRRRYGVARKPGETDEGKFQRKGISGDWKNHFDARSCKLLDEYEGSSLRRLGYESDAGWVNRFADELAGGDG